MKVDVLKTDNEQQRKFQVDLTISQSEKNYSDSTEALQSPLASKIFGFPWTQAVQVGPEYVLVTKQDWVEWSVLEEPLAGLIKEHLADQAGEIEENPKPPQAKAPVLDSDEAKTILVLIEEQINPALASHGGYVVLHSVQDNKVYLEMGGGCQGCAMSYQTLKEGIETSIRAAVPSIETVVDVTRHDEGQDPFYA